MPKRSLAIAFLAGLAVAVGYVALLPGGSSRLAAIHALPCADLDGDGKVTLVDFKIESTYFGVVPLGHPADMNQDQIVNIPLDILSVLFAYGLVTDCQDTAIGFGGTLTPTPAATPVPAEISLTVKNPGASCDTPPKPAKCTLSLGSTFTLSVTVNQAPPTGYTGVQTQIHYGALTYKPTGDQWKEVTWPDVFDSGEIARRSPASPTGTEGLVSHAAISGAIDLPYPLSFHTGSIVEIDFTCESEGSFKIALPAFSGANSFGTGLQDPIRRTYVTPQIVGQQNIDLDGDTSAETVDVADALLINCAKPVRAAAVSAGNSQTCAVTAAGGAKCWGWNETGQLGDGTTDTRNMPTGVSGLSSGVAGLAGGGAHTCALTTGGGVKCWGYDRYGQLGGPTSETCVGFDCSTTPVDVSGLTGGAAAVVAGDSHTCALTATGGAQCWGRNNGGQLGDGTNDQRETPVDVCAVGATPPCTAGNSNVLTGIVALAAGASHTCALNSAGGLVCWGSNSQGQLGNGTTVSSPLPVNVTGLGSGVAAGDAGGQHTCAVMTTGGLKCWGNNDFGQVGDGTTTQYSTPQDVSGLTSGASAVATGELHTCALTVNGALKCWGRNRFGQLGNGTTTANDPNPLPIDVSALTGGVAALATGYPHTCARLASAGIMCWGANGSGQLGDGTKTDRSSPVDVFGLGKNPSADTDGDTVPNASDPDDDGDGCTDVAEQQTALGSQNTGGRRDAHYFWDFFDVWTHPIGDPIGWERDKVVTIVDILGVAGRFGANDSGPGIFDRNSDPLTTPNPATGTPRERYHPSYDRGPIVGANNWDVAPADGAINLVDDILGVARQFGHSCL